MPLQDDLANLRARLSGNLDERGLATLEAFAQSSGILQEWLHFVHCYYGDRAPRLLISFQASIVEGAGYAACGLGGAVMMAQRKAIELSHAWLYFADQPLQWRRALQTGEGFEGREAVQRYLKDIFPGFRKRLEALESTRTRRVKNPYGLLSKFIHSQGADLLHVRPSLAGLVSSPEYVVDLCVLQREVAEYIHDNFSARFLDNWPLLSPSIRNNLSQRLGDDRLAELLRGTGS